MKELHLEYTKRKKEIGNRLLDFSRVKSQDYFYELCFCILTPQSKGKRCDSIIQQLRAMDFLHQDVDLIPILKKSTRFHHTKARSLLAMKKDYPAIFGILSSQNHPSSLRAWLVHHVKGIGMKEASHFLRNIGYTGLAILDRHILRNLVRFGVLPALPRTLTPKIYLDIEQQFISFSKNIGISMDELDLLFWSMQTGEVFK